MAMARWGGASLAVAVTVVCGCGHGTTQGHWDGGPGDSAADAPAPDTAPQAWR